VPLRTRAPGQHEQAIVAARRQLSRIRSEGLLRLVAASQEALGQLSEASATLAEVAALSGESAETLLTLGQAQVKSGDKAKAIRDPATSRELSAGRLASAELRPLLLEAATQRARTGTGRAGVGAHRASGSRCRRSSRHWRSNSRDSCCSWDWRSSASGAVRAAPQLKDDTGASNMAAAICRREATLAGGRALVSRKAQLDSARTTSRRSSASDVAVLSSAQSTEARCPLMAALERSAIATMRVADTPACTLLGQCECSRRATDLRSKRSFDCEPAESEGPHPPAADRSAGSQRQLRVADLLEGTDIVNRPRASQGLLLLAQAYTRLGREGGLLMTCARDRTTLSPNDAQATAHVGIEAKPQAGVWRAAIGALEAALQPRRLRLSPGSSTSSIAGSCRLEAPTTSRRPSTGAYSACRDARTTDIGARLKLARLQVRSCGHADACHRLQLRVGWR